MLTNIKTTTTLNQSKQIKTTNGFCGVTGAQDGGKQAIIARLSVSPRNSLRFAKNGSGKNKTQDQLPPLHPFSLTPLLSSIPSPRPPQLHHHILYLCGCLVVRRIEACREDNPSPAEGTSFNDGATQCVSTQCLHFLCAHLMSPLLFLTSNDISFVHLKSTHRFLS